jgi:hypothetical protein
VAVAAALRGRRGRERYVVGEPEKAAVAQHAGVEAGRGIGGGGHASLSTASIASESKLRACNREPTTALAGVSLESPRRESKATTAAAGITRTGERRAPRAGGEERKEKHAQARRDSDSRLSRAAFPPRAPLESPSRESKATIAAAGITRTGERRAPRAGGEERKKKHAQARRDSDSRLSRAAFPPRAPLESPSRESKATIAAAGIARTG